jgi:hypothetical protein
MTQADQSADRKGEVRPLAGKDPNLEDRIADEKDAEMVSDGTAEAEERKRDS